MPNTPIKFWEGREGDDYTIRNYPTAKEIGQRQRVFEKVIPWLTRMPAMLEVGANVGANIEAIRRLDRFERYHAVEPNDKASMFLSRYADKIYKSLFDVKEYYDLTLFCGVLIHIPEENLEKIFRHVAQWSNSVLICEYFAPTRERISYRDKPDLLWRDDYGRRFCETIPKVEFVDSGFIWKPATGMDNLTWWLFQINH